SALSPAIASITACDALDPALHPQRLGEHDIPLGSLSSQPMSSCGESDVAMATGQREPTLLRGCSTRRPVEDVEHQSIAAGEVGEIHGQIASSAVQDRAELCPESLAAVVIEVTLQGYVGVPGATPCNGDRLLGLGVQVVRAAAGEIVVADRIT
ncbi:MAG TPA: hypothetical protein VHH52_10000, partial [Pseudonocardiaceae bacterium]|nr:hypothetical protein [Pseudonocardiaceae bacterium]